MMFQQARETIVETCINLANRGYLAGTGGNMALRAGEDHMLVTPSGVDYYTMGAEDICVIRLSDHQQVEGEMEASVESGMHVRVLAARPDCLASVHTHQPIASAYTLLAAPLAVKGNSLRLMLGATNVEHVEQESPMDSVVDGQRQPNNGAREHLADREGTALVAPVAVH
mgnify:CR=1 FL=1